MALLYFGRVSFAISNPVIPAGSKVCSGLLFNTNFLDSSHPERGRVLPQKVFFHANILTLLSLKGLSYELDFENVDEN
jgi:hypothetical protein